MAYRYLRKAPLRVLRGTALVRLDFNTEDEWRLVAAVPTVQFLLKHGAKVVIISHRGRPHGPDAALSLKKDARALAEHLKRPVKFIPHFRFREIKKQISSAPAKTVFLLENLRFIPGEAKNDRKLAHNLALLSDYFVNDAFAVCHRAAASVAALPTYLPSYVGLELEQEIVHLSHVMGRPKRPLVFVIGGGKAHDKLGVLHFFRKKADAFLLGGASANTILKLQGRDVASSLIDDDVKDQPLLADILKFRHLEVPQDLRIKGGRILDIGSRTAEHYGRLIAKAGTVVWSGPMGLIEDEDFSRGSATVARAIAENRRAFTVTGGGETVMFVKKLGLDKKFSFISTGGGALLEFLAGEKLPGLEALRIKK